VSTSSPSITRNTWKELIKLLQVIHLKIRDSLITPRVKTFSTINYYHLAGPIPIPILGTLIQIGRAASQPHLAFPVLAKKYGDVYSVKYIFFIIIYTGKIVFISFPN
jgi:hypothetical protein